MKDEYTKADDTLKSPQKFTLFGLNLQNVMFSFIACVTVAQ